MSVECETFGREDRPLTLVGDVAYCDRHITAVLPEGSWDVVIEPSTDQLGVVWTAALYWVTTSGDCSDQITSATASTPQAALLELAHNDWETPA